MTGVGERAHLLRPDIDLDFHIDDIVSVLEYEDLHEVILVGHSYGGMVITGVADRATDRKPVPRADFGTSTPATT
jgi:pimeloyl-ACP methyl ester carboxylesterase